MTLRKAFWAANVWGWAVLAAAQAPDLERMDFVLKAVPDGPVAKVNGVSIPREDFASLYQTELAAAVMQARLKTVPDRLRLDTALRSLAVLVQREVLFQEAAKRDMTVTRTDLERAWQDELERVGKTLAKRSDGPLTEEEILAWAGIGRETALARVRKDILIEKVRDALAKQDGVTVTDEEIAALFDEKKQVFRRPDQCHLKQVFAAFGPQGGATNPDKKRRAHDKIQEALERIRAGENFEAVARAMSEAPGKENGGDMGLLPMASLPPAYAGAAYALQPGQISDLIETEFGCHLIKLVEFVPGAEPDFDKAKPLLRRMILVKKTNEVAEAFCDPTLKAPGAVQVFLELEKTLQTLSHGDELRRGTAASLSTPPPQP